MKKLDEKSLKKKFKEISSTEKPKPKIFTNCIKAFIVGGIICDIAQFINDMYLRMGIGEEETKVFVTITMVFLGAFFTGLGVYDKLGDFAGAGSVVPITGFANSIVAPAIEFKKEGYVLGIGCKMFTIAGPVLVYGLTSSFIVGIIYYLIR